MPKFTEHCKISREKFGEDGEEYHRWIDQYTAVGYRHRQVFHHKEGVEVGVQLFGEKARKHLEQHIRDDYLKKDIPTIKELRGYPRATDGLKEKKHNSGSNKPYCKKCLMIGIVMLNELWWNVKFCRKILSSKNEVRL